MPETLDSLKTRLARVADLQAAAEVLEWDQETFMPDGAAEARAHQIATLRQTAHQAFTDDEIGALLDGLPSFEEDTTESRLVQVTRRDYERARCLPGDLVAALARTISRAKQAWKQARADDDFAHFAPHLERLVVLTREKAEAYGYEEERYDALLEEYEPGMRTATVTEVFGRLRDDLVPIVEAIAKQEPPDASFLHGTYDPQVQWDFGLEVIEAFGYDFQRGRQDRSTHPFTTSFSISDVRLTTRVDPAFFSSAFFSTLHEAGHGLYEQGIDPALDRTPLADGTSLGMHESQSRLWENQVGRSRAFWSHYFPEAQRRFPEALGDVSLESFYRGINRVEPSLIRVEADEVTYNLHIMLRFEIERALIEGTLGVEDLPERWNAAMEDYLGLTPPTNAEGVLQDIHWSLGSFGYFPTYALGTLMSAQIYRQAQTDLADLEEQIATGSFGALRSWLQERIHRHGRARTAQELLREVTDSSLEAGPWLAYVREKFGAIYDGI